MAPQISSPCKKDLSGNIVAAGMVCGEEFGGVAQGHVLDKIDVNLVVIGEAP